MRRVFKYPLEVTDRQFIDTFAGWKPLSLQVQGDEVCLWAEVDDESTTARYRVFVHGTGHALHPDAEVFAGTFQLMNGGLIFHVFTETLEGVSRDG
ncbi:DUF7352 domain-containing protein [Brevibacterium aurantiacum]|uniref:DUF7352 domain-containing protein n=1 Tax=Brevibacterium aurantiacum TaxID=273384 RepID=UPI003F8EB43B